MDFTSEWLNGLFNALNKNLDSKTKNMVLAECSKTCTTHWALKAQEIRQKSTNFDIEFLLHSFIEILPGGGPDITVEGSRILWSFSGGECPCPIGQITKNPEVCNCSIGHVKGMLEPLLERSLEVKLEQSRLRGDSKCAFIINIIES